MVISRLHQTITTPRPASLTAQTGLWFGLSLAIALVFAWLALQQGLSSDRLVQDDARQYVFWMQRFHEPDLFPQDLIADYFQSVTPLGYVALYRLGAALGFDPFTFNKLIPVGLSLVTTSYFFWLVMAMVPLPPTSFLACLLLNHTLWMKDDLVSATPRSFVYPLFLAFLYYLLDLQAVPAHSSKGDVLSREQPLRLEPLPSGQSLSKQPLSKQSPTGTSLVRTSSARTSPSGRSLLFGCLALGLLGFFYPQYVLVAGGVVTLMLLGWVWLHWPKLLQSPWRLRHQIPRFLLAYLGVTAAVLAFYALTASKYGPVVTLEQAWKMPEFWPGGRSFFFSENLWWFYGVGDRSGFLHVGLVRPASLCFGIFLPMLLAWPHKRWRGTCGSNPILRTLTPHLSLLGTLLASASGLFVLAHLLLFRLHLPSRYTDHSLRIIMAIAAAIVLTVLLEWLLRLGLTAFSASATLRPSPAASVTQPPPVPQRPTISGINLRSKRSLRSWMKGAIALTTAAVLLLLVVIYPVFVDDFPLTKYKRGNAPQLYAFFRNQPQDTLIASLSEEVNNIPVFAQRSILVGREYAIPYHWGYYEEFRDRALAVMRAQYSPDWADVVDVITAYGIDFWMLDRDAFEKNYLTDHWTRQYLEAAEFGGALFENFDLHHPAAIAAAIRPCTVAQEGSRRVLEAQCMIKVSEEEKLKREPSSS